MVDDGIGRLLLASLHQGIGEVMPLRLEYYEHWLTPTGLRDGRMALAPLGAVLSFLRQEGPELYDAVMRSAGTAAAEWSEADRGVAARGIVRALPVPLRLHAGLRLGRQLVRSTFAASDLRARIRAGQGTLRLTGSVFCDLREPQGWPACAYYAAALERQLALLGLAASVRIGTCRAEGGGDACDLHVVSGSGTSA